MSQSSRPTRAPRWVRAQARFTEQVDLPTPPLPLATATMRLMPGTLFWFWNAPPGAVPGAAAVAAGCLTSTKTWVTPGWARMTFSHSALTMRAASGLGEVSSSRTFTAPSFTAMCLTSPNEMMSRE